jgi:monoamine oxidase
VTVRYVRDGREEGVTADFAVCAVPFSVLRTIDVSPAFSAGKLRAVRELSYANVARTYVQCREKFWRTEGLSGFATTDLPTTYFWESTSRQPGTRGVLQGWLMGTHARRFQGFTEAERKAFALAQSRQVFPRVDDFVEKVSWISWQEEPWARGAFAWLRPGDGKTLWPHLASPEGRVHFAGEHTSTWFLHGSLQGALESGRRAARAINDQ